jgi:hypothetical protein
MILSKQKQNYVLDKAIESINISYDYELDKLSFSKTFNLKYTGPRQNTYKVSLYFYENKLSKVTLYRSEGNVEIESDGHVKKFELIKNLMYEKIQEIDNKKFKNIFPEYDLMEERNDILDEILNDKEEEVNEVKEKIDVKEDTIKRKKLFGIF